MLKIFRNDEKLNIFWKIMADNRNLSAIFKLLICPDIISFFDN